MVATTPREDDEEGQRARQRGAATAPVPPLGPTGRERHHPLAWWPHTTNSPGRASYPCVVQPPGNNHPCAFRSPRGPRRSPWAAAGSGNDPAAGSPTTTLLRLLLPLAAGHCKVSAVGRAQPTPPAPGGRRGGGGPGIPGRASRWLYPNAIGSNDGRCVQMAGTQSVWADDPRILGIPRSRQTVAIIYPQYGPGSQGFPPPSGQAATQKGRGSTPSPGQCSARAAQDIWEHHRPAVGSSMLALCGGHSASEEVERRGPLGRPECGPATDGDVPPDVAGAAAGNPCAWVEGCCGTGASGR